MEKGRRVAALRGRERGLSDGRFDTPEFSICNFPSCAYIRLHCNPSAQTGFGTSGVSARCAVAGDFIGCGPIGERGLKDLPPEDVSPDVLSGCGDAAASSTAGTLIANQALDVVIRPLADAHVAGAARLHQRTFPEETMAQLGLRVVEALYRTYVESPRGIAFVATHAGNVVAVVCGALGPGFVREVLQRHYGLILVAVVGRLFRSPRIVGQLAGIASRGDDPWGGDPARRFYWRTQAVAAEWRGKGIILPLTRALLLAARERGAREACSTVFEHNLAAIWVHKVFGFETRVMPSGPRHYRLDLERWNGEARR